MDPTPLTLEPPGPNFCSEASEAAWHVVLREPSCVHLRHMSREPMLVVDVFSVRINDLTVTQYTFVDGDEAERTWHEIIPASTHGRPTLRPDNNELVFFARDGSVVFGDVVIVYTSNQTTIPIAVIAARP
jgi:hypothetical protein